MSIHIPSTDGEAAQAIVQTRLPEALPVLPLRDTVPFPETLTPLAIGQDRSIQLVNDVLGGNRMLVMVASTNPSCEEPGPDDVYRVGVAGVVSRMLKVPDGTLRILVHGAQRVELKDFVRHRALHGGPHRGGAGHHRALAGARGAPPQRADDLLPDHRGGSRTSRRSCRSRWRTSTTPSELANMIAGALRLKTEEKQKLLEERAVIKRLRMLSEILARELELVEIGTRIQSQVQSEMDQGPREYWLRQQLKAIQEELGEVDEAQAEAQELREQLDEAGLPEHARKQAERELQRFERLPPQSVEHGVIRTYLEWLATLPWSRFSEDTLDLAAARKRARRGPLRHGVGEGPHPRVPRGTQAQARRALVDPLLRRAAGRGQDLAGQVGRGHARALLRAHLGGWRPRRVGDPRPSPHLHRRDARHDPARDARRGHAATPS